MQVRDPSGGEWDVGLRWIGRHLTEAPAKVRRRSARARAWQRKNLRATDGLDIADAGVDAEAAIGCLVVIAAFVALFLLLLVGPWIGILALGLVEVVVVAVLAVAVFTWRVVARRPWATGPGVVVGWRVVGYRRARQVERDAAAAIARGGDLVFVHTDLLDQPGS